MKGTFTCEVYFLFKMSNLRLLFLPSRTPQCQVLEGGTGAWTGGSRQLGRKGMPLPDLDQQFSKCGHWTTSSSSSSSIWDLVRNADSQQTCSIRNSGMGPSNQCFKKMLWLILMHTKIWEPLPHNSKEKIPFELRRF